METRRASSPPATRRGARSGAARAWRRRAPRPWSWHVAPWASACRPLPTLAAVGAPRLRSSGCRARLRDSLAPLEHPRPVHSPPAHPPLYSAPRASRKTPHLPSAAGISELVQEQANRHPRLHHPSPQKLSLVAPQRRAQGRPVERRLAGVPKSQSGCVPGGHLAIRLLPHGPIWRKRATRPLSLRLKAAVEHME